MYNAIYHYLIAHFFSQGLGTSSDEEAQTYFENISIHKRDFLWQNEDDGKAIDLAFNSDKPEDRRTWLKNYTVCKIYI